MFPDGLGIMFFIVSKQGRHPKLDELVKSHFEEYLASFFSEACEGHCIVPGVPYISDILLNSCSSRVGAALAEGWVGSCSLLFLNRLYS